MSAVRTSAPRRRGSAALLCLALAAGPAGAAAPAAPRFPIEAIDVRGLARLPPQVVTSESLLVPGREYSEDELRDAVHRIERLPFVLAARFALSKGSGRGRYRLEIEVEETRSFFFAGEARWTSYGRPLAVEELGSRGTELAFSRLAGFRRFFGPYDVVFLAASEGDGLQLGWTRYRLLGRPFLLSFEYTRGLCCEVTVPPLGLDPALSASHAEPSETFEVTAGLPLGGNRGLRLELESRTATDGTRRSVFRDALDFAVFDERREERAELTYLVDSSDDPFFPASGGGWSASLDLRTLDAGLRAPGAETSSSRPFRSQLARLTLRAARHFGPTPRQTLTVAGRLSIGTAEVEGLPEEPLSQSAPLDLEVWDLEASLRHTVLLSRRLDRRWGEPRWETRIELGWEGTSPSFDFADNPLRRTTVATGLVLRNEWGIFRLTLSFLDLRSAR